jgi:hypothetical protein
MSFRHSHHEAPRLSAAIPNNSPCVHPHTSYLCAAMILILAILAATRASPTGLQPPPLVSLDQFHISWSSCDDPNRCRSLGNIIRSCIITIFLCSWVSMHPNIPSPDEGWPKVAWRHTGLMFLALLVPEAVIAWALRQQLAAAELAKQHKGES